MRGGRVRNANAKGAFRRACKRRDSLHAPTRDSKSLPPRTPSLLDSLLKNALHAATTSKPAGSEAGYDRRNAAILVATTQTKRITRSVRAFTFNVKRTPICDPSTVPAARMAAGIHSTWLA